MLNSNFSLLKQLSGAQLNTSFDDICNEIVPIAKKTAKSSKNGFENAMELLLHLEKLTRIGNHIDCNIRVIIEIVNLCVELRRFSDLNKYLVLLANRRLIIKKSIVTMVTHCLAFVESLPKDINLELTKTLYNITEGKNYLEIERARLAKILADRNEKENNIEEAIKILEDLKCETIGNMEIRDKVKLQLQLIRLLILHNDFVKSQILSKKIPTKFLEQPEQQDLKLIYYNLMIILDSKENYLTTSKHYLAILNCYDIKDPMKLKILGNAVLYCVLAPYSNEQKDSMENIIRNKLLEELPLMKEMLSFFMQKEIIDTEKFLSNYRKEMNRFTVLDEKNQIGIKNWIELNNRLIEHNIIIISTYYTRIYLQRMSEILSISQQNCESIIANLVTDGRILAKIDRMTGIIDFVKIKQNDEILNDWSIDLGNLMEKVNRTYHEVNKIQSCIATSIETPVSTNSFN